MSSVNKCILLGNLGKDPEVRTMQNGNKVVNLSLATSESWNDRASGERKERTEWHRIVIFNDRIADYVEKSAQKGTKLYVEGALKTRKWTDQQGQDRYTTEIEVGAFKGEVTIAAGGVGNDGGQQQRSNNGGGSGQRSGGQQGGDYHQYGGEHRQQRTPSWEAPRGSDLDDEVSF